MVAVLGSRPRWPGMHNDLPSPIAHHASVPRAGSERAIGSTAPQDASLNAELDGRFSTRNQILNTVLQDGHQQSPSA